MRRWGGLMVAAWLMGAGPLAQAAELEEELDLVEAMAELEEQLNQMVVSITKTRQRAEQAPAVVTVVTGEEIEAGGYGSLAEVLRTLPGFYDVYDLATHNVGVRGINGGARASGSVLKVMIDGMPVDYRPTTGNFFGEELIPLAAISRVEVIRGPASALYGANALLGVVNVITRSGEQVSGARVIGQASAINGLPGGGGTLMVGGAGERLDVLVAAGAMRLDRSGLALPDSSPRLANTNDSLAGRGLSRGDRARPRSLLGRATLKRVAGGTLSLLASVQNLDARGEFQDFGPLSHGTRLDLVNQSYRLTWEIEPTTNVGLQLSGRYFNAGTGDDERFDIGRDDYVLLRRVGAEGFGLAAEARVRAGERLTLTQGVDFEQELHLLQSYDRMLTTPRGGDPAGTVIPDEGGGETATFRNLGAFVQGVLTLGRDLSAVAGARLDWHSAYGANPTGRAGLVWAPEERPYSLKLLAGSSFKAPSAEQLYTRPMAVLDVIGSPRLEAQQASTAELAGAWRLARGLGEVSGNVFLTSVKGRVEYVQTGLYREAQNVQDAWLAGGELDARVNLSRALQLRLAGSIAHSLASSGSEDLEGLPEVTLPLFPTVQAHLSATWRTPWWGLRVTPELSWISARESSQSNALELGQAYQVPAYLFTALAISTSGRKLFGEQETRIALRLNNLLDHRYVEPGFGGVDLPAQGFSALLTLAQSL